LTNGQSMNVFRRMAGATNWGMALETNLTASSYADTNVLAGERYEYQVTFNASQAKRAVLSAAIRGAPVESRGRLVLLVDKALAARYRSIINSALRELIEDLIGDGWTVVRKNV